KVLKVFGRHPASVEVSVVEGDRVLDQVLELSADLHPAGEAVTLRMDDPDLAHRSGASSRTLGVSLSLRRPVASIASLGRGRTSRSGLRRRSSASERARP